MHMAFDRLQDEAANMKLHFVNTNIDHDLLTRVKIMLKSKPKLFSYAPVNGLEVWKRHETYRVHDLLSFPEVLKYFKKDHL